MSAVEDFRPERTDTDAGSARARVLVIYTGGTIGMAPEDPAIPASPRVPAAKEDLLRYPPHLARAGIDWELSGLSDMRGGDVPPLDSSDVSSQHWIYMAAAIERSYELFDGFVILHGTDTMAYTSSALSFLLQNLSKSVVITGSQLPISSARTDAVQNLITALYIAGYKATGLPLVPEVVVCFGNLVLRGNRVRKVSTTAWQGFSTPNFPPLGTVGETIQIHTDLLRAPIDNSELPFFAHKQMVTDVIDVGLFPGIRASQLASILSLPDVHGVVLRTFGAGNSPGYSDFLDVIEHACKSGKVILNITQCLQGTVEMGLYAASNELLERGVISGIDMTPEAALTKLMWILSTVSGDEIQTQLQISQRGEQSQNLFDVRYGPSGTATEPQSLIHASARPSGRFRKAQLERAMLRISHAGFVGAAPGESVELRVFINMPQAHAETPTTDPHCVAVLNFTSEGMKRPRLASEVTAAVRRLADDDRPIVVTLVPSAGVRIWYAGLYLALFARP